VSFFRPRSGLSLGHGIQPSPDRSLRARSDSRHAITEPEPEDDDEDEEDEDDDEDDEEEEDEEEDDDPTRECGAGSRTTVIYANPPTQKVSRGTRPPQYGPPVGPLPPIPAGSHHQHQQGQQPKRRQQQQQQEKQTE
jgi:hypothetical protein